MSLAKQPALHFHREVCKLIPGLIRQYDLGDLTTKHTLRQMVAQRCREYKSESNPDTIEMLILKGRQELQEMVERYVTRQHVLIKWVKNPDFEARLADGTKPTGHSAFLDSFMETNYPKPSPPQL